jgi:hypothetical protein
MSRHRDRLQVENDRDFPDEKIGQLRRLSVGREDFWLQACRGTIIAQCGSVFAQGQEGGFMKRCMALTVLATVLVLGTSRVAFPSPVLVTYTSSVSGGTEFLDFTVTNDMPVDQNVYLLAVDAPNPASDGTSLAAPAGWFGLVNHWAGPGWPDFWEANAANGGAATSLPPGQSVSGFITPVSYVPKTVDWIVFATAMGGESSYYYGADNLNPGRPDNPEFAGVASLGNPAVTAPEPSALLFFGSGLVGVCGYVARRRNR